MRTVLILVSALALVGCVAQPSPRDTPASLTADQAIERYQPLFDEITTTVQEAYPGHVYSLANVLDVVDANECIIWIGDLENRTTPGEDREDYLALIEPFAEEAGFSELTEVKTSEGVRYAPSFVGWDDRGTELRVTFDNPGLSVSIVSEIIDDPCPK